MSHGNVSSLCKALEYCDVRIDYHVKEVVRVVVAMSLEKKDMFTHVLQKKNQLKFKTNFTLVQSVQQIGQLIIMKVGGVIFFYIIVCFA